MNAQDEMELELWQELRHLPPAQRMQALDDQMRMDSLLRSFYSHAREDEYEELLEELRGVWSCPEIIGSPSQSHSSGAL